MSRTHDFDSPAPASPGSPPRVAVLGAGPVGLDAALAARERGWPLRVYEAASAPAANVRSWGHVRLFTPWEMNLSARMRAALSAGGSALEEDRGVSPTGHEYADRVLDPLWALPELREALAPAHEVVSVGRAGFLKHEAIGAPERDRRPFRILVTGPSGREQVEHADVVLDCTGRHGTPNTLGDGGIPALGERRLDARIERKIPDPEREGRGREGRTTLLVGAGHSAQTAARALAEAAEGGGNGTRVLWATRNPSPGWGAVPDDPLPLRRSLTDTARELADGASPAVEHRGGVVVDELIEEGARTRVRLRDGEGRAETVRVDRILGLTGGVGDASLYRQLQVHECYATAAPMKLSAALLGSDAGEDCLAQESHGVRTLESPEPGFYILGDKSYGRNSTFLLRTGWSQVDEVFGALDGERG